MKLFEDLITLDCIQPLSASASTPYLEPEPKSIYSFDAGAPILIDMGIPIDPQNGSLSSTVNFGNAACCLTVVEDTIIKEKDGKVG